MKIAHGLNYNVKVVKESEINKNPESVLDMASVRASWKGLSVKEKFKYKKKAQEEKNTDIDSTDTAGDKKRERDRKYRRREAVKKLAAKDKENSAQKDLLAMFQEKKVKLEAMIQVRDILK